MSVRTEFTREERSRILDQYEEAWDRGDREAARKIIRQLPIHPGLVRWVKETFTEEEIKEKGIILPTSKR